MGTKHILINGDCRNMSLVPDESVQLIVTSPPYWQLKDYGTDAQIGFNDTYEEYVNNLNVVWNECFRVLEQGCRLCINIGDQFARSVYYGRYKVVPIHAEIIKFCETIGFDYMGSIIWQKPTSMHTTGGGKVMGSYPYPRGGIVKVDYENILLFKKIGKAKPVSRDRMEKSKLSVEEWNEYFCSHWTFEGARQDKHIAVFPENLPKRLIKMFSFVGEVDVKKNNFGSKFETDKFALEGKENLFDSIVWRKEKNEPTVLVNHARAELRQLMIQKGICYLRAGDSKGSVLVQSGFERLQYVLLHTAGNDAKLFKLKAKGKFQIWTKETLIDKGFNPHSSPYYIVLHFDNQHPIQTTNMPNLREDKNTYRARIKKFSEFV